MTDFDAVYSCGIENTCNFKVLPSHLGYTLMECSLKRCRSWTAATTKKNSCFFKEVFTCNKPISKE
jgi:hypothetical protein